MTPLLMPARETPEPDLEPSDASASDGSSIDEAGSELIYGQLTEGTPGERRQATGELRDLLLAATRHEVNRRLILAGGTIRKNEREDLAQQSADDALLSVLGKLDDFRGDSRFTTWAWKFALFEAGTAVRRRSWQQREIPLEEEAWNRLRSFEVAAERQAEDEELLIALRECIEESLSAHQREVLVAVALNDVPIDVLAGRLDSTRGALYKTLHDARRNLRAALEERGFDPSGAGMRLDETKPEQKR